MKRTLISLATVTIALLGAGTTFAQTTDTGGLLRDKAGKTLYTFDKDGPNESRCFDACATAWPPFMAGDAAQPSGKLGLVARKGGGQQWAWDGKPLYYFAGDAKAGDTHGDGSGGVWHTVQSPAVDKRAASPNGGTAYRY
jgi:predicted lipoprotein with Yx(FWY)xxD motif